MSNFMEILDEAGQLLGYLQGDAQHRLGVHNLLHVQDQKAQGTAGGAFTSGAWRTRDLNTVLVNNISGATLVNNQITLPSGTYFVDASAPAFSDTNGYIERHQAIVKNITDAIVLLSGMQASLYRRSSGSVCSNRAQVSGVFTLSAQKVIELQHRCTVSGPVNGFGQNGNFTTEVYSDVKIWKVA